MVVVKSRATLVWERGTNALSARSSLPRPVQHSLSLLQPSNLFEDSVGGVKL